MPGDQDPIVVPLDSIPPEREEVVKRPLERDRRVPAGVVCQAFVITDDHRRVVRAIQRRVDFDVDRDGCSSAQAIEHFLHARRSAGTDVVHDARRATFDHGDVGLHGVTHVRHIAPGREVADTNQRRRAAPLDACDLPREACRGE